MPVDERSLVNSVTDDPVEFRFSIKEKALKELVGQKLVDFTVTYYNDPKWPYSEELKLLFDNDKVLQVVSMQLNPKDLTILDAHQQDADNATGLEIVCQQKDEAWDEFEEDTNQIKN